MVLEAFLSRLNGVKQTRRGWMALCPAHQDSVHSLSITERDGKILITCFAGCEAGAIVAAIGLGLYDLFFDNELSRRELGQLATAQHHHGNGHGQHGLKRRKFVASLPLYGMLGKESFCYEDCEGRPVIYVERKERENGTKTFTQWGPSADGNDWQPNLDFAIKPRPLHHLPRILQHRERYVVHHEGEKCDEAATRAGLAGIHTTNLGGANGHRATDYSPLKDRAVILVPDNDEPGRQWAKAVSDHCLKAGALSVKIVSLPGVPEKGDIVEWLEAGGTPEEFQQLIDKAETLWPDGPIIKTLSTVRGEHVSWLRRGRIAKGKLTLNVGPPGVGKSYETLDSAARLSRGRDWPEGNPCPVGSTVLLTAEDNLADTIRPRLDLQNADLTKIHALEAIRVNGGERLFDLSRDLPALHQAIRRTQAQLVVIDPLTAYLGSIDSHKEAEVRGVLAPLAELASETGVAIVAVMHLNKSQSASLLNRTVGSIGFVAAARMVFAFGRAPEDDGLCLVIPVKNNVAALPPVLGFRIGPNGLLWQAGSITGIDTDRVFGNGNTESSEERTTRQDAAAFLLDFLADGSMPADKVFREGKKQGFSPSQLRRARQAAKVLVQKAGFSDGWVWRLAPEDDTKMTSWHLRQTGTANPAPDAGFTEDDTKMTTDTFGPSSSPHEDNTPSQDDTPLPSSSIFYNHNNLEPKMTKMTPGSGGEEVLDLAD
jgi:putative DNA primase/helicase